MVEMHAWTFWPIATKPTEKNACMFANPHFDRKKCMHVKISKTRVKPLGPSLALASYKANRHIYRRANESFTRRYLSINPEILIEATGEWIICGSGIFDFFACPEILIVIPPAAVQTRRYYANACMFKFSSAVLCSVRRKRKLFYHHWAAHSFPPKINFPSAILFSVQRKRKFFYHHWAAHSFPS